MEALMSRRHEGFWIVLSFLLVISSTAFGSSFKAVGNYPVGNGPVAIVAEDLNGDGKIDLAVANSGSKTVSVLLGNGDGTFGKAVDYEVGVVPSLLVVTDLNQDGRADIVVRDASGSKVSMLLGTGDGGFAAHVEMNAPPELFSRLQPQPAYRSGTQTASVVFADFNGDGQMDEAVSMSGRNMVSVLLNVTPGSNDGTDLLENSGFETGALSPWAQARDFCGGACANWAVLTYHPEQGNYDVGNEGNIELRQNFSATETSSITRVALWIRHPAGTINASVDFFYSNGDDDEYSVGTTSSGWDEFDVTNDLAAGKSLNGFSIWGYSGGIGSPITFADGVEILVSN
jgi:hypothetical protein